MFHVCQVLGFVSLFIRAPRTVNNRHCECGPTLITLPKTVRQGHFDFNAGLVSIVSCPLQWLPACRQ